MAGWHSRLSHPIVLLDGTRLETLSEARAFILCEPQHIQARISWQEAAELLMAAAEDSARIKDATEQIEMALFLEARLAI
jgi:hypothetical protein